MNATSSEQDAVIERCPDFLYAEAPDDSGRLRYNFQLAVCYSRAEAYGYAQSYPARKAA